MPLYVRVVIVAWLLVCIVLCAKRYAEMTAQIRSATSNLATCEIGRNFLETQCNKIPKAEQDFDGGLEIWQ